MDKVILVPNGDGGVGIIYPAPNCGLTIEEIARKDGPAGQPYMIVDVNLIPQDHTFFDAFEADFSNPHGYSIGPHAWFIERYTEEISTLDPETEQNRISFLRHQIAALQLELAQ